MVEGVTTADDPHLAGTSVQIAAAEVLYILFVATFCCARLANIAFGGQCMQIGAEVVSGDDDGVLV